MIFAIANHRRKLARWMPVAAMTLAMVLASGFSVSAGTVQERGAYLRSLPAK